LRGGATGFTEETDRVLNVFFVIRTRVNGVLNIILCHQGPVAIKSILARWEGVSESQSILLAHGGSEEDFRQIEHDPKVFVSDPRLRTQDHQRELQSLTGVLHAVRDWLAQTKKSFQFVHLAEYDQLPLVRDLSARQIARLEAEHADVLTYHLDRVDGTNRPHYLYHASNPNFHPFLEGISKRKDPRVVLLMFGAGPFWRRAAFDAVAARAEPFPMYNEIYLPTLAHHLGFRVRDFAEQNAFVSAFEDRSSEVEAAKQRGAWILHPVKNLETRRPA
jgi:hypothetical protein